MSNQLTEAQRYELYLGLKRKWSQSRIAEEIGVSRSTVCREVRRNSKPDGSYVWKYAQTRCMERRLGFSGNCRKPDRLWWRVERMLVDEDWSPEQISGVLRNEGLIICKQTIYNHIHADVTGRMAMHTPHGLKYTRRMRRCRHTKASNIRNRTSIHDRPEEADGRRFGDWEMDTIVDSYGHAILTLTERSTNFILMERLPHGRKAKPVAKTVIRLLLPYRNTVRTITTDNGCEFAKHEAISRALSMKGKTQNIVFFADSYCSWQKGAVENANKLIRRYIKKKANFNDYTDKFIMAIQHNINKRPRKKLKFNTTHRSIVSSIFLGNVAIAVGLYSRKFRSSRTLKNQNQEQTGKPTNRTVSNRPIKTSEERQTAD